MMSAHCPYFHVKDTNFSPFPYYNIAVIFTSYSFIGLFPSRLLQVRGASGLPNLLRCSHRGDDVSRLHRLLGSNGRLGRHAGMAWLDGPGQEAL